MKKIGYSPWLLYQTDVNTGLFPLVINKNREVCGVRYIVLKINKKLCCWGLNQ